MGQAHLWPQRHWVVFSRSTAAVARCCHRRRRAPYYCCYFAVFEIDQGSALGNTGAWSRVHVRYEYSPSERNIFNHAGPSHSCNRPNSLRGWQARVHARSRRGSRGHAMSRSGGDGAAWDAGWGVCCCCCDAMTGGLERRSTIA
jgi:hypothetical protein